MSSHEQLQPYGAPIEAPAAPPPEPLPPGYVYPCVVWSYIAIAGTFLCSPIGLVAGIVTLTRRPLTHRARMLGIASVLFSSFSILSAILLVMNTMAGGG